MSVVRRPLTFCLPRFSHYLEIRLLDCPHTSLNFDNWKFYKLIAIQSIGPLRLPSKHAAMLKTLKVERNGYVTSKFGWTPNCPKGRNLKILATVNNQT